MSEQVADLLDDAADLLERDGWIVGAMFVAGMGRCALGAIDRRDYTTGLRFKARDALRRVIGADMEQDYCLSQVVRARQVAKWNDTPGRTKQQVLDALRLAAKRERMDAA
jgi:hypothetical protein